MRIKVALFAACLAVGVVAQSGSAPSARFGSARITGYTNADLALKGGVYQFTYTGPKTQLNYTSPLQTVQIVAPRIGGQAAPAAAGSRNVELRTASASGGVRVNVQIKEAGRVARSVKATAQQMVYTVALRKVELTGNVRVETDDPNAGRIVTTGTSGTVTLDTDGGYRVNLKGGETVIGAD